MATEEQIERLRALSKEIDELYSAGDDVGGAALLERALREAEGVDPAYTLFFQGEQASYLQKDRMHQEALFRKALEHRPDDYFLLRNSGVSFSLQGKEDEAIACYEKALKLNLKDHASWRGKGVSLSNQGRESEASMCFDKALELDQNDYNSWQRKGVSLSKQNKDDEAIACYEKALELNPKDFASWRQKGVSLVNQGQDDMALKCTIKALELKPGDANARTDKAYELYQLGQIAEALALIEEVAKANPAHDYAQSIHRYLNVLQGKTPPAAPTKGPKNQQMDDLKAVVERVRDESKGLVEEILQTMKDNTQHITGFLGGASLLRNDLALFFVLRKWNSYTRCIPREDGERSIGGGYFFLVNGKGTVVDPGYNFLENFNRIGGRITDIDNIVITHAHNDHTADLESILSLLYKFNAEDNRKSRETAKVKPKAVKLFLNAGCQKKFSGLLDLRGADYLEDVQTLMPDHSYDLGEGLTLRALPAYHDEVVAKKYAVGLHFQWKKKGIGTTNVIITSDTGLFQQKDGYADTESDEIWTQYKMKSQSLHLLIPHIGSVKEEEFKASWHTALQNIFYPNHLGLMGISGALNHRLAIINNQTFGVGEEGEVTANSARVRIVCKEIKDDSVVVLVKGQKRTLHLRPGS